MNKIVFFRNEETEEEFPVKILCRKEDSDEKIEEKANNQLMNILEDDCDILDYEIIDIKDLVD